MNTREQHRIVSVSARPRPSSWHSSSGLVCQREQGGARHNLRRSTTTPAAHEAERLDGFGDCQQLAILGTRMTSAHVVSTQGIQNP
jgi:hypothetical protein